MAPTLQQTLIDLSSLGNSVPAFGNISGCQIWGFHKCTNLAILALWSNFYSHLFAPNDVGNDVKLDTSGQKRIALLGFRLH